MQSGKQRNKEQDVGYYRHAFVLLHIPDGIRVRRVGSYRLPLLLLFGGCNRISTGSAKRRPFLYLRPALSAKCHNY